MWNWQKPAADHSSSQPLAGQSVRTAFPSFYHATKMRDLTHSFFSMRLSWAGRRYATAPIGRYDNLVPTRFLTPRDCSKNPALYIVKYIPYSVSTVSAHVSIYCKMYCTYCTYYVDEFMNCSRPFNRLNNRAPLVIKSVNMTT
jgi:hypothetical protein